ncbi:MAG TPA: hypothetical protein VGJ21_19430 [Terracidiphilus sp.]|jgi:hypothetical protein
MHNRNSLLAAAMCCLAVSVGYGQASSHLKAGETDRPRVQVLSASQMAAPDAAVLAGRRSEIAGAAEINGFDVNTGTWIQNQVVCPDAPRHLIMHYVKLSPDGSVSLFTAIVPRDASHVRIIPVLYHGAPAGHVLGSTESQRDLINGVISTKAITAGVAAESDWTSLAYCYAALGGAEPTGQSVTSPEETTPIVVISPEGKVREMSFSAMGPGRLYQDWRIEFDRQIQVKSIALSARTIRTGQPVPVVAAGSHPVPVVSAGSRPVPVVPAESHAVPAVPAESHPVPQPK